jgi:hypothetical protein
MAVGRRAQETGSSRDLRNRDGMQPSIWAALAATANPSEIETLANAFRSSSSVQDAFKDSQAGKAMKAAFELQKKIEDEEESNQGGTTGQFLNDGQWTNHARVQKRLQIEVPAATTMDIARVMEALAALQKT